MHNNIINTKTDFLYDEVLRYFIVRCWVHLKNGTAYIMFNSHKSWTLKITSRNCRITDVQLNSPAVPSAFSEWLTSFDNDVIENYVFVDKIRLKCI